MCKEYCGDMDLNTYKPFGVFPAKVELIERTGSDMSVSLIAAMDRNGCIGKEGGIPWKLSSDMKRFKMLTVGKPCIMGRKTFESMDNRPLINRGNIVLSSKRDNVKHTTYLPYEVAEHPVAAKIKAMAYAHNREIMVIGGTKIYETFLPQASRMYLTFVDIDVEGGDTFFPAWNKDEWNEVYSEVVAPLWETSAGAKPDVPGYTFKIYDRVKPLPLLTP